MTPQTIHIKFPPVETQRALSVMLRLQAAVHEIQDAGYLKEFLQGDAIQEAVAVYESTLAEAIQQSSEALAAQKENVLLQITYPSARIRDLVQFLGKVVSLASDPETMAQVGGAPLSSADVSFMGPYISFLNSKAGT